MIAFPKHPPLRSDDWKNAVRSLGYCVRCMTICQPDCCHRNEGKGMGMKAPDSACWAGCRLCHVDMDQGRNLTREDRRAETDRLIVLTHIELAARGILTINLEAICEAS